MSQSSPVSKKKRRKVGIVDYHDFTTKDTPWQERKRLNVGDIWINAVQCAQCKDIIRSKNKHNFVTCSCGILSVDGGSWYQRILGDIDNCKNLFEEFNDIKPVKETPMTKAPKAPKVSKSKGPAPLTNEEIATIKQAYRLIAKQLGKPCPDRHPFCINCVVHIWLGDFASIVKDIKDLSA